MLVLTRKTTQQIQIGNNVTITILQVKGQSVRVGIEAPKDVRVVRAELPRFDQITLELGTERSSEEGEPTVTQIADAGFTSPRPTHAADSQEGRSTERRRIPNAPHGSDSPMRPSLRLGTSSLKELVAARRARR